MTATEYQHLKRFNVSITEPFIDYFNKLKLEIGQLFMCYDMGNQIRFVKVVEAIDNICFDVLECSSDGNYVRCPYKKGNIKRYEIAERLYEGDWRLL